jgi:hypothetical protein
VRHHVPPMYDSTDTQEAEEPIPQSLQSPAVHLDGSEGNNWDVVVVS